MSQSNKKASLFMAVHVVMLLVCCVGSSACSRTGGVEGSAASTEAAACPSSPSGAYGAAEDEDELSYEEHVARLQQLLRENDAPQGTNVRDASSSASVQTTSEASVDFSDRGFGDEPVCADSLIDGTYTGFVELDKGSTEKHPSYEVVYTSPLGITWDVLNNDGTFQASPIGVTPEGLGGIVLTELDYVVQYDALDNEYSDFTIDDCANAGFLVQGVARIDKETLDSYSLDRLKSL